MTANAPQWTAQQSQAIGARGQDLLVTASAGTGKTAVLSQRCVDILQEPNTTTTILNLLILTFTDSAAEEMRTRIREKLTAAAQQGPEARRLQREVLWLPGAAISTIHAFCKRMITEHFHDLGLDPNFRLIDTDEQRLLQTEVLEQVLNWAWEQDALQPGLRALLRQRDVNVVSGFPGKILALSGYLDGVVSRRQWYAQARLRAENGGSSTGDWARAQQVLALQRVEELIGRLQHIQRFYQEVCTATPVPALPNAHLLDTLAQMQSRGAAGDWPGCVAAFDAFTKKNVTKPKAVDESQAIYIQAQIKQIVSDFLALGHWAVLTSDYFERLAPAVCLQTQALLDLTETFDRMYRAAKQRSNCLDFADLEHYALQLLTEQGSGTGPLRPSRVAQSLQQQYHHIFVDEYQDVNPVQQAILQAVQRGDNLFVVGDVKQSIYAFRGAQPAIFQQRLASTASAQGHPKSLRIDLNTNFRSDPEILDFVNRLCQSLMTQANAGLAYDDAAWLRSLRPQNAGQAPVELHILDEQDEILDEEVDAVAMDQRHAVTSRQRQAALVAQRILELVGQGTNGPPLQIRDQASGRNRPLAYRDIAVLLRSPAQRVHDYVRILRNAGIPVNATQAAGYFDATEIRDCLNVLKVLDNPQRDIEMAAVLRGPFFHLSDTDLVRIKLGTVQKMSRGFCDRVVSYSQRGEQADLADRLQRILAQLAQWRQLARESSLANLIWTLIRTEGLLSTVLALPGAQVRRANLLKLHDRAIQFEGFASNQGAVSLHRFVEFIEQLQRAGVDWASAEPPGSDENAVCITSIHKSKGLEYPVVFLAELNGRFSRRDTNDTVLMDQEGALGLQVIEQGTDVRLDSLAHQVIAQAKTRAGLAEELRILYVAVTRAKSRLILTGSASEQACLNCLQACAHEPTVPLWFLQDSPNPLHWILAALGQQRSLKRALGLDGQVDPQDLLETRRYGQAELRHLSDFVNQLGQSGAGMSASPVGTLDQKALVRCQQGLDWRYAYQTLSRLPAKRTVSQLVHPDAMAATLASEEALAGAVTGTSEGPVAASVLGTATHLVLARLSWDQPVTLSTITRTIQDLQAQQLVSAEVAKRIDCQAIVDFDRSALGQCVREARKIYREWPFTLRLPVRDLPVYGLPLCPEQVEQADDYITVQGIADLLIVNEQGLQLIDFKTDRVARAQVDQRADLYRNQLRLYSRAARTILQQDMVGMWLYFLHPGVAVEIA